MEARGPNETGKDRRDNGTDPHNGGNNAPPEHVREKAGDHILFCARIRSRVAKQRGEALSDLDDRDIEQMGRYPAAAEVGVGGELVPQASELRDTVTNPDYVTVDASRDRLELAQRGGVLELALDAADTVDAKNSLEKMLVHQMSVLHRQIMKLTARMDDLELQFPRQESSKERNEQICRLASTVARLTASYQSGFLALQRVRSGGRQVVTVQHVHVGEGGQAVVAGKIGSRRGVRRNATGGARKHGE
jgi:hypothetical protein